MPAPGPRLRSLLAVASLALAGATGPLACGDDKTGEPADASAGGTAGRGTGGTAGSGGAGTGGATGGASGGVGGVAGATGGGAGGATGGTGGVSGTAGTGGSGGGSADGGDAPSLDGAGDVTAPAALAFTREFAPGDVLRALGGTGPMDVWVIPDGGTVWVSRGDGMFPRRPTDTGAQLTGVWGTAPDNVYVSVRSNFVLRWTGSWKHEAQGIPAGTTFRGIHGSGPNDVYAYGGRIFRSAGDGVWAPVPIQDQLGTIQSLWVAAPGDVWAVDTISSVYHLKAGTTTVQQTGAPGVPRGIWASGPTDIYLVTTGAIAHSRGDGRWTVQQTFAPQTGATAIWGAGPNAVFVGTFDGRILRSGGDGQWVAQTIDPASPGYRDVLAIWGTGPSNVYVATTAAVYHGR